MNSSHNVAYPWRWKNLLLTVGIEDARTVVGKKIEEVLPFSRTTVGRKRSHIAEPKVMKHNADQVIREHYCVLDQVFEYLTKTLRVSITHQLVTEEFELELSKRNITWRKDEDDDKDHKLKVNAVYNYRAQTQTLR